METNWNQVFRDAGLPLSKIAALADVSVDTLRSLSSRGKQPKRVTRERIASALRAHAATLSTLADQLDDTRP